MKEDAGAPRSQTNSNYSASKLLIVKLPHFSHRPDDESEAIFFFSGTPERTDTRESPFKRTYRGRAVNFSYIYGGVREIRGN